MADTENPLYPLLAHRQAEFTETLISAYANSRPRDLLAHCERMIHCLAGFDTIFLMSPAGATHHLGLVDDEWLQGFDKTLELLCLTSIARKVDFSPVKGLAFAARSFWTRLAGPEETKTALTKLFEPGISGLFDLKRKLMVEIAQASSNAEQENESLVERLLAGPDDVELLPRELALLEAHLRQRVSFAAIQQEKKATGHSPTEAARNKLKLIRDFNQGLRGQGDGDEPEKPSDPAPAVGPEPAPKRSTERGEGRAKLIAALTKHHQYADGGCLNLEPIGNNQLAKAAGVSPSTASTFFNDKFQGHTKYKAHCRDAGKLVAALKLLNDEFAPYHLLGELSSSVATPEEEDTDAE